MVRDPAGLEDTRGEAALILEVHDDEPQICQAIRTFWTYQLAGLRGLWEQLRRK